MATVITSSIGTGGDYASIAAWFAAAPASLVAADQIWRGELKNEEFTSGSNLLNMTGKTVDATRYFELTTAPGASFIDHPTFATNALRYDATKGAAVRLTSNFAVGVIINLAYTRISKIQFSSSSTASSVSSALSVTAQTNGLVDVNQCIVEGNTDSTTLGALKLDGPNNTARNTLVVQKRASATSIIMNLISGARAYNVTAVSVGATLNFGVSTANAAGVMKNCYVGGVTAPTDGVSQPTKTTCFSNAAATGFSVVPFDTTTFENITSGTHDLRLKAGSALIDAGTADATFSPYDIFGVARPQGAGTDVGAYEYPSAADITAPTLTSPTGSQTGSTTSSGSVSTNENTGTLFWLTTVNATETQAAVLAGASQAVSSAGTQNVVSTGLTASTTYYNHFVHRDGSSNSSAVASSASFTTTAGGDSTAPVLSSPTATQTGSTTASGSVSTNEANGTLYRYVSTSSTATAATVKASGQTSAVTATGVQNVTFSGLPPGTLQYAHYLHRDAAGNDSAVSSSAGFTTGTTTGSFTTTYQLSNNASGAWPQGTAVHWQWHQAGRIGTAGTGITYGSGTLNSEGKLVITGCPLGAGFLLASVRGDSIALDKPYYESGTVA